MAPFVGLQPHHMMRDMVKFEIHRSRIPTTLFKSIVEDMDIMLVQYGPPIEHRTVEAKSQFVSPVSAGKLLMQLSESKFALRSLIVLLAYSTLLFRIYPNPFSKVAALPKAECSIALRHLVLSRPSSSNTYVKPALHKSAGTLLLKQ